jgi:hypothetical protein
MLNVIGCNGLWSRGLDTFNISHRGTSNTYKCTKWNRKFSNNVFLAEKKNTQHVAENTTETLLAGVSKAFLLPKKSPFHINSKYFASL